MIIHEGDSSGCVFQTSTSPERKVDVVTRRDCSHFCFIFSLLATLYITRKLNITMSIRLRLYYHDLDRYGYPPLLNGNNVSKSRLSLTSIDNIFLYYKNIHVLFHHPGSPPPPHKETPHTFPNFSRIL